jgi:predicted dehydrogenase
MRVALLGADATSLELVAWVVQQRGATLVAAYDCADVQASLDALCRQVRRYDDWEAVLASDVDAVVVGRGGETRLQRDDQLRKLAQAALPLVVVCPACDAVVGYEIEMIRQAAGGRIVPYLPGLYHPAVRDVAELVRSGPDGPLGQVEQILWQRELADRSRVSVLAQLAGDLTLLRLWIGRLTSLSASGPPLAPGRDPLGPRPSELPSLAHLSVHLTGASGRTARWSVVPPRDQPQAVVTLLGSHGQATLSIPREGTWELRVAGRETTTRSYEPRDRIDWLWAELEAPDRPDAGTSGLASSAAATDRDHDSPWLAVCRDQEAVEAVDQSLLKGRAIELFNEPHTEEASFKGAMALGGCALLLGMVLLLLVVAAVEGLRLPIRRWWWWPQWPVLLLTAAVAFLFLQLLGALALRSAKQDETHRH